MPVFNGRKKSPLPPANAPITKHHFSQRADRIILNRWLGLPIFFAVMYALFVFAVNIGGAFQDFFDIGSDTLFIQAPALFMQHLHAPAWLIALICHGVGKGINTTITFMPVIAGMFLGLSILEDSGYMARAAFVVDRLMRQLGLPGHAFVPMIVGFGCNVPAVMGTRSLSHRRDRIITSLMMPFMSCGARLAIFAVFAAAFFPQGGQNIIFALYGLGIAAALFTGWLLRHSLLPGPAAPLIMEMPAYHRPHWRSLWRHTWQRLKHFVFRAGKVIVPVCMILGLLNHITVSGHLTEQPSQRSLLARTGQIITPVFTPMGIQSDNWPATMGLLTGVLAKEVVVGTLNSLYAQAGHYQIATQSTRGITQGLKNCVANDSRQSRRPAGRLSQPTTGKRRTTRRRQPYLWHDACTLWHASGRCRLFDFYFIIFPLRIHHGRDQT